MRLWTMCALGGYRVLLVIFRTSLSKKWPFLLLFSKILILSGLIKGTDKRCSKYGNSIYFELVLSIPFITFFLEPSWWLLDSQIATGWPKPSQGHLGVTLWPEIVNLFGNHFWPFCIFLVNCPFLDNFNKKLLLLKSCTQF